MTRRKGLTRKTPWVRKPAPMKRQARLKPRSDKKAAWVEQYLAEKERRMALQIAERGATWCQKCTEPKPVEGHHPGGQNGARIMVFFLICNPCHHEIHFVSPRQARLDGWLTD